MWLYRIFSTASSSSKMDLTDPSMVAEIHAELLRVQRNLHAAEKLVDHVEPALALLLEKGLSPAAELAGVCLARGIPLVQYVSSHRATDFVLKRFNPNRK